MQGRRGRGEGRIEGTLGLACFAKRPQSGKDLLAKKWPVFVFDALLLIATQGAYLMLANR